jgi:hypothetical protein
MGRLSTFRDVANHCAGWLLTLTGIAGSGAPILSPNNGLKIGIRRTIS